MKKINMFDALALCYLYLPIIVFSLTWLNPIIGIPIAVISCYLIWSFSIQSVRIRVAWRKVWPGLILVIFIIIGWTLLSGLGGFFAQSDDWAKHNLLLSGFIDKDWPVHYHYQGKDGVVSYYIGEYLLPALVGKITNFNAAQIFLLIWISLGLLLLTIAIYKWIGKQNIWIFPLIIVALIFFAPFIYPLSGIYANWMPSDANIMQNVGEWFSRTLPLQYSSDISLLRFVYSQFVPVALSVSIWMRNRSLYKIWGTLLAPIVLYSTFNFLGLAVIMMLQVLFDLIKNDKPNILSADNVLSVIVILILALYIACNILQPKPISNSMHLTLIPFWQHKLAFLVFQVSWLIWILLLLKSERKNSQLYIASILLLVLPFFKFGAANDLVMRVSVPALIIINLLVIKNIACSWKKDTYYALILLGALIIAGSGPLWQLRDAAANRTLHQTYNMPYKSMKAFYKSKSFTVYQYVDWDQSKLRNILLRK